MFAYITTIRWIFFTIHIIWPCMKRYPRQTSAVNACSRNNTILGFYSSCCAVAQKNISGELFYLHGNRSSSLATKCIFQAQRLETPRWFPEASKITLCPYAKNKASGPN